MVSTDWDFSDPGQASQNYTDRMHTGHPGMTITQFVGPYTFTDPAVTATRATALATWVIANRDDYGDEIGLHIHPYCNFVTHAGLTCITDQSTVYATDTTGYTIKVGAYGRADFGTLLTHAKDLFVAHGLGTPTLFRAGGWTATMDLMLSPLARTRALSETRARSTGRASRPIGRTRATASSTRGRPGALVAPRSTTSASRTGRAPP